MADRNDDAQQNMSAERAIDRKTIARSAFKIWSGSLLGLVMGLAGQVLIASFFGAGQAMDAYFTALAIPAYFQSVFLATLSFVFIPAFVQDRTEGNEDAAWALVGTFFWFVGIVFIGIAVVIAVYAEQVIGLLAPGLSATKAQTAATMLSILIFVVPFNGFGNLSAGIQNARDRFFWPAARSTLGAMVNVLLLLALQPTLGVMALPWGYLGLAISQSLVTTVPVLRHGWTYKLPLSHARVREMLVLLAPLVLFGLLTRVTPVLERYFASGLPDGDLSYLGYAGKISRIAQGLLSGMVTTAIFPVMSKAFTRDGREGLAHHFKFGVRLTLAISVPVVAIVAAIGEPLIALVFERGAFTAETTQMVSRILPIFVLRVVLLYMIGNLTTRAFYVVKDTRTVPITSSISVLFYAGSAVLLTRVMGYTGLAIASVIHSAVGIALLLVLLVRRKYIETSMNHVARLAGTYLLPGFVAFITAWLLVNALDTAIPLIQVIVPSTVAGMLYLAVLFWLDPQITGQVLEVSGVNRLLGPTAVNRMRQIYGRL